MKIYDVFKCLITFLVIFVVFVLFAVSTITSAQAKGWHPKAYLGLELGKDAGSSNTLRTCFHSYYAGAGISKSSMHLESRDTKSIYIQYTHTSCMTENGPNEEVFKHVGLGFRLEFE